VQAKGTGGRGEVRNLNQMILF